MIHIDASTLEGGGQLPRLALCLSALTLTPIHLTNIRANRASQSYNKRNTQSKSSVPRPELQRDSRKPGKDGGLKESHIAALEFLAEACDAKVTGAEVGSREVIFKPRRRTEIQRKTRIALKNPGSVFLIFQALFPYLVFAAHAPSSPKHGRNGVAAESEAKHRSFELTLIGGTNVDKSMSVDYVQQVFLPICEKIGLPGVQVECMKRGWAGHAGEVGEVSINVMLPTPDPDGSGFVLDAFDIEHRGAIEKVVINVLASSKQVRDIVKANATSQLKAALGESLEVEVSVDEDSHHPSRFYMLLVAHTSDGWRIGRDFLGSGKKARNEKEAEVMVDKAVTQVVGDLVGEIEGGGCVDEHMQDQLVCFQALARGSSVVRGKDGAGTLHTRTARWVCEQVLGERGVRFDAEGGCEGVGINVREDAGSVVHRLEKLEIQEKEDKEDKDQDHDS